MATVLSGCGGGGSGPVFVAPTPPPPPPPAPPPTGPASSFRTTEYLRNAAYDQIGLADAFAKGGSGAGVLVSIIDTGIDRDNPEFAGRIDSRSADLVIASVVGGSDARATPSLDDIDGHGTSIAGIIGAAKNDLAMHGIAPLSTLLVFRVDKANDPDVLVGEAIFEGVLRSVSFGAKVMNFSFGSNEAGVREEYQGVFNISSNADILTVIAGGNDGAADPDLSALAAVDPQAKGTVIIAGSVNSTNTIASFSSRAGAGAEKFLVAPGVNLQTTQLNVTNGLVFFSGTSASTAVISGAAALVRQLWPQLTAAQAADVLFTSATDLGAPGTDAIYGRGLLNLTAAVQPLGSATTTSITGSLIPVAPSTLTLGPAYGSAVRDFGSFVFLDSFGRDFSVPLTSSARSLAADPIGMLAPFRRHAFAARPIGEGVVQFRLVGEDRTLFDPERAFRVSNADPFSDREREQQFDVAFTQPLGDAVSIIAAQGFAPREIDALAGRAGPRTLSRDAFADAYLPSYGGGFAGTLSWSAGSRLSFDVLAAAAREPGTDAFHLLAPFAEQSGVSVTTFRAGATRVIDGGSVRLEAGMRTDQGGLLGARFDGVFGGDVSSATYYHAASADVAMGGKWRARARYSIGMTTTDADGAAGFLAGVQNMTSTDFSAGAYAASLLRRGDLISISVSQPLRIESGGLTIAAPSAYDLASRSLVVTSRFVPLGDGPREIDFEASYGVATRYGFIETSVMHQTNVDGGSATLGLATFRSSF